MKTTMKDIARECNLTPAAVSLALSGASGRVSEKTRQLVLETAHRLNYMPNRAAISLATQRSGMVGVIMSDLRNTHIASMFMSVTEEVQNRGYSTLCHIVNQGSDEQIYKATCDLIGAGVDGIFFSPTLLAGGEHRASLDKLELSGIPVVCNADFGIKSFGSDVFFDFAAGGHLATNYLLECGHTRVGCVAGPLVYNVTLDRLNGYRRALEEHGLAYEPQLVYEGDYSIQSGGQALAYLLGQKVTAIFSFNDEMAFGLYQSARQYNVRIPEDISVIGCDNVPFSDVLSVPLSTINIPTEQIGRKIANKLINHIEKGDTGEPRTVEWYQPDLILRGSIKKRCTT